ncbi:MAG: C45 family autoproteolytic acyltransferase/hydrolase [Terracidiphilus sp.]|nr:C45 family autoproteolytic acyltransferase/hydrolase [Terracidiphilus sp.]
MRLISLILLAALALPALATPPAANTDPRLRSAYTFERDGWTYLHLEGTPAQIGFQHGSLLAHRIEDNLNVYRIEKAHDLGRPWSFYRTAARDVIWPRVEPEYREELQGIVDGLHSQGSKLDLWDVVALNSIIELGHYYLPAVNAQEKKVNPPKAVAPGKCTAFIATGSATKGGRIVIAHNNWSSYAEGERWTIVFDIVPAHGQHILMEGMPGAIASDDDFGINAAGIMITETTLPNTKGFDPAGIPEFVRARKAMQYATSIDDYVAIMRKGNNGGYANSWLVGDRKTGEIAYLELGLHHTPLTRKKDGYFVSSNFAIDPGLIRDDTKGFDPTNPESTSNARRTTAEAFIQAHYGHLDASLAEAFLSDHWDNFDKKIEAGTRSLCGHEDTSSIGEKTWGDAPYTPSGAVSGKVADSELAAKMSFIARAGHPCGEDFLATPFLAAHPEFRWQQPILGDMKAGPWATFTISEKPKP